MNGQTDPTGFAELMSRYLADRESRRDVNCHAFAANKAALMPILVAAGITIIELPFDGCGDSGMVQEPETRDAIDLVSLLQTPVPFSRGNTQGVIEASEVTLGAALEELAYEALSTFHPGWEINEGSFGRLVIDTEADAISLQCSLRSTDYHEDLIGDE